MQIIEDKDNKNFIELLKKFDKQKDGGLLIFGKRGIGKTFLSEHLVTHNYFVDEPTFMQVQKNGEMRLRKVTELSQSIDCFPLEALAKHKVVIYDDYGTGAITEAYITNMLYWINSRISRGLKTIITTNLSEKELLERETRIGSRIFELCDRVELSGEDKRLRKSKKIIL